MGLTISTAARNAAVNGVVDLVDAGGGAGELVIKTGSDPAAGTTLATIPLAATAWGSASAGSAALAGAPKSAAATGAGSAGCFRVNDSTHALIFSGAVTATSGGGDIELDNVSIAVGQTISITALAISIPAS